MEGKESVETEGKNEIDDKDDGNINIQFKKRGKINGIRKKGNHGVETEKGEDAKNLDNDDDFGIHKEKLNALEILKKTSKEKNVGISVDKLNKGVVEKSVSSSKSSNNPFGTQFSSRLDYGLQQSIPHENIMHEYINEKLGVRKETQPKKRTIDDELYTIPDELKVESALEESRVKMEEEEGVVSSWSTGIAEIQLPSSYKSENITQTQEAARKAMEFKRPMESGGFQRFQIVDPALQSISSAVALDGSDHQAENNQNKRRKLKSTDDYVLEKFKQSVFEGKRK